MVNLGAQFGKVMIKVACRVRTGQTLPLGALEPTEMMNQMHPQCVYWGCSTHRR